MTVYILLFFTNKLFVDVAYKHLISGKYLNKSCKSLSSLVHFLLFTVYLTYLSVWMILSAVLKFANFIISLFFTSLTSRIFIVFLFLKPTHTILFNKDFLASTNFIKTHVNRHPMIYDTNFFDNNFNLFNMFLTNFNSSVEFAIYSRILSGEGPYHMESSPPICNINPLTHFYMVGDFSGGYSQTNCNFKVNVNVTVDSYMNSSFNFNFSHLLIRYLPAFRIMKLESTS